jgi:peptidoglycan hydrolase CwlO-like protein
LRTRVSAIASAAALALTVAAFPRPASAETQSLSDARRRVAELTSRIEREQASVRSLQTELRNLSSQVGREQRGLDAIQSDLGATTAKVADAKAHLQSLREQLASRARTLYMRGGPVDLIGVMLGARTFTEFIGRATYTSRVARHDEQLVLDARETESKLRALRDLQRRLERDQAGKVTTLRSRQDRLTDTFARQQAVLADLAKAKREALDLLADLQAQLGAGLAGLRRVAGQGMTISYGEWAGSLLPALGAGTGRENMIAIVAWEAAEGTEATWNPLATTKDMPGATVYNSHGVRNYVSKQQGIDATVGTIELPNRGYEPIIARLRSGADAMKTAEAIRDSLWCSGCAGGTYVVGFIEAVRRYYDRYAG